MGVVGSVVGGLLGSKSSKAPAAPVAPTPKELSEYKSYLDDPILSTYAKQAFGDLGYDLNYNKAGVTTTPGGWETVQGANPTGWAKQRNSFSSLFGRGGNQEITDRSGVKWKKSADGKSWQKWNPAGTTTAGTGRWEATQGAEPTAYGNIRTNYGNEYKRASDQLFNDMASRGILRSGATGDAANKMAQATATGIANAIEGSRQSALDRLNSLLGTERSQQANATNAANSNQQNSFQNANTAYANQMASRQNNINELSTILGGIGGMFGGGKKSSGVINSNPEISNGFDFSSF